MTSPVNPSPEDLLKIANMPMPFGRYKGTCLIDLPEPYVVWFYNKGFPEGELGRLLGLLYELKVNGLESLVAPLKGTASAPVQIPADQVSPEALDAIIESFVLREGTDYGKVELSLEAKTQQVKAQILLGEVRILFDPSTESVNLVLNQPR